MSDNGVNQVTDFDAFWAEYSETAPKEKVRFLGELLSVPFDLPMELEQRMTMANMRDKVELASILEQIYGQDVLERWTQKKVGAKQFAVLVAWTLMRVQGGNMTPHEVAESMKNAVNLGGKLKTLLENTGEQ